VDAYPGFRGAAVECLLCVAPRGEPSAAPAPRESGGFSVRGDVTVHLRRAGSEAGSCGLVAWERLEGTRDRREVVNASPKRPLWSEEEPGGLVWTLNARDFRNGQVKFELRSCAPALARPVAGTWNLAQGREVWITEGDPTLRFGDAAPARAEAAR